MVLNLDPSKYIVMSRQKSQYAILLGVVVHSHQRQPFKCFLTRKR